jgi:hypothetical protein
MDIIENCKCRLNGGFVIRHNPKASGLDWCPNPQCPHGVKGNNFQPYEGELHMDKMQIWNVVSEDGDIRCTSSRLST